LAADLVQHLGPLRLEPGAFAGGHDHHRQALLARVRSFVHCCFSAALCGGCGIAMSTGSTGPRFNASRPGLISDELPTTSTASLSGCTYLREVAFRSSIETFSMAAL